MAGTAAQRLFARSPLWQPIHQRTPEFAAAFARFLDGNPYSTRLFSSFGFDPRSVMIVEPPPAHAASVGCGAANSAIHAMGGRPPTYMMAFPLRVTEQVADTTGHAFRGALTSLVDSSTSIHVMDALLPHDNAHVSVGIHATFFSVPLHISDPFVIVSRLNLCGTSLVIGTSDFLRLEEEAWPRGAGSGTLMTVAALDASLKSDYQRCVHGRHVKAILPQQRAKLTGCVTPRRATGAG